MSDQPSPPRPEDLPLVFTKIPGNPKPSSDQAFLYLQKLLVRQ